MPWSYSNIGAKQSRVGSPHHDLVDFGAEQYQGVLEHYGETTGSREPCREKSANPWAFNAKFAYTWAPRGVAGGNHCLRT